MAFSHTVPCKKRKDTLLFLYLCSFLSSSIKRLILSNALGRPLSFLKRCRNLLSQQRNFSTKTNQTYLGYWPYPWLHRSQTRRSKEHVPSKEKPESERVDGAGDNLGTPVKAPPPALLTKPVMISLTPQRKASLDKDDKITPR